MERSSGQTRGYLQEQRMTEGDEGANEKTTHYCVNAVDVKCDDTVQELMNRGMIASSLALTATVDEVVQYLLAHLALVHVPRTLIVVAVGQREEKENK
jgi:hypothetical protein